MRPNDSRLLLSDIPDIVKIRTQKPDRTNYTVEIGLRLSAICSDSSQSLGIILLLSRAKNAGSKI